MKTYWIFLLAVVMGMGCFLSAASGQEDMVVVDNSGFENPRRTAAAFQHDQHNEIAQIEECNGCHHVYADGKRVEDESSEDQKCADCHETKASGRRPALMKAYHLNCKRCHQSRKKGPILCGECHVK